MAACHDLTSQRTVLGGLDRLAGFSVVVSESAAGPFSGGAVVVANAVEVVDVGGEVPGMQGDEAFERRSLVGGNGRECCGLFGLVEFGQVGGDQVVVEAEGLGLRVVRDGVEDLVSGKVADSIADGDWSGG